MNPFRSLLMLVIASAPLQAQQVRKVTLYYDTPTISLDTAHMDQPTWFVLKARVVLKNGTISTTKALSWRSLDTTVVRLRQVKAQSVVVEAPMGNRFGKTRVIGSTGGKADTLWAIVKSGVLGVFVRPDTAHAMSGDTVKFCAYEPLTGGDTLKTTGCP